MADSGTYDDATIARKQKIAEALLMDSFKPKPIVHWTQGLAQMAQAGLGGYLGNQASEEAKSNEAALNSAYLNFFKGGSTPPAGAPMGAAAADGMATPASVAAPASAPTTGKIYTNDEPSPLDPPSGEDRKNMIATILGEAGNQGAAGQNAVASVIRNRAASGAFGGDTPTGVVTAPNQFEPWNTAAGRSKMAAAASNPAQAAAADNAIALAYGEGGQAPNDPTNGATMFFAPKAQAALGRQPPAWGRGAGQDIGDHRFFGGATGGTDAPAAPYQVAGPPTAPPANPVAAALSASPQAAGTPAPAPANDARSRIAGLLSSSNRAEQKLGRALAQGAITQDMKGAEPTDEIKEYNLAVSQAKAAGEKPPTFVEYKTGIKKAGAQNISIDQKPELAFDTKAGQLQAERFNDLAADGQNARQMISDINTLNDLGKQIGTGKEAEIKAALGPYAEALGMKIDKLGEIQAYEAVVNRLAPNLRVKGSGAQSDMELKNFLKSLPTLGNTPEGNEIASTVLKGLQENKIRAAEIGSKALNKEITRSEAERQLRELPDPMEGYRAYQKANKQPSAAAPAAAKPTAPAAPKAGDVIDGYRFKGGDPSKRANWEQFS